VTELTLLFTPRFHFTFLACLVSPLLLLTYCQSRELAAFTRLCAHSRPAVLFRFGILSYTYDGQLCCWLLTRVARLMTLWSTTFLCFSGAGPAPTRSSQLWGRRASCLPCVATRRRGNHDSDLAARSIERVDATASSRSVALARHNSTMFALFHLLLGVPMSDPLPLVLTSPLLSPRYAIRHATLGRTSSRRPTHSKSFCA
jgi:hypothetical protein